MCKNIQRYYTSNKIFVIQLLLVSKFISERRRTREFCARVSTCPANRVSTVQITANIAVYLYCYLDGIRCSWIIICGVTFTESDWFCHDIAALKPVPHIRSELYNDE